MLGTDKWDKVTCPECLYQIPGPTLRGMGGKMPAAALEGEERVHKYVRCNDCDEPGEVRVACGASPTGSASGA